MLGMFARRQPKTAQEPQTGPVLGEDITHLRQALQEVITAVSALQEKDKAREAEMSAISLSWAETLDKINRWAGRQAARHRRDIDAALQESPGPAEQESPMHETKAQLRRRLMGTVQ